MKNRVHVWVQRFGDRPMLQLQWTDPGSGRRRTKTAGTADPKEAEKIRADWEYELNHGQHREGTRIGWQAFRELFEAEHVMALRPRSQRLYARTLDLFEEVSRPATLAAVTERMLSGFVADLRNRPCRGREGMVPKTIRLHVCLLRAALGWAKKQRFLTKVPRFPFVKLPKRQPRGVAGEHFERLYDKAPDQQMRAYLLCAWRAGLRLSEALALEREETDESPWLDLVGDRIVFPADHVKAGEDQTIPLDAELREALLALPRLGPRRVFRFIGRDGHELHPKTVSARVVKLARAAGVRLTYHALRRGFCSYYAARVPAAVLTRLTRNTLAVAMQYYVDVEGAAADAVRQRNAERNTPSPESRPTAENSSVSAGR